MIDRFYSSQGIADELLSKTTLDTVGIVADFAAGNGMLLKAARRQWPHAQAVATDLDARAIRRLRKSEDTIIAEICDFIDPDSRESSVLLRSIKGAVDLVLLNPPFSCRGGQTFKAEMGSNSIKCSLAMAFVVSAASYVARKGEILAIMPSSSFSSEKDVVAYQALAQVFHIEKVGGAGRGSFSGCASSTQFLRFRPRGQLLRPGKYINAATPSLPKKGPTVFRGKLQMHTLGTQPEDENPIPLVHSTELRNCHVDVTARVVRTAASTVRGPAILLPRVGEPSLSKICVYKSNGIIAISDCVIAIKPKTHVALNSLYDALRQRWPAIKAAYVGTGAKYLTIKRLTRLLNEIAESSK